MPSKQHDLAKMILGGRIGGPALGYSIASNEFIVYSWYDAPVCTDIIGRGATIYDALHNAWETLRDRDRERRRVQ